MQRKPYKKIHYFFNCYHCGAPTYSDRRIKRRKCFKCGKFIIFNKVKKTELKINPADAPKILMYIKLHKKLPMKDEY